MINFNGMACMPKDFNLLVQKLRTQFMDSLNRVSAAVHTSTAWPAELAPALRRRPGPKRRCIHGRRSGPAAASRASAGCTVPSLHHTTSPTGPSSTNVGYLRRARAQRGGGTGVEGRRHAGNGGRSAGAAERNVVWCRPCRADDGPGPTGRQDRT